MGNQTYQKPLHHGGVFVFVGPTGSEQLFPRVSFMDTWGVKNNWEESRNQSRDEPGEAGVKAKRSFDLNTFRENLQKPDD